MKWQIFDRGDHYVALEYCLRNSWRLRRMPGMAEGCVDRCLNNIAMNADEDVGWMRMDIVKGSIRARNPRNPILIWVLLNLVLPIVIRLVLQWLRKRFKGVKWESTKA